MKDPKVIKQMEQLTDFEYRIFILCNKICGASHYNMQMKFIVETQEEYDIWMCFSGKLKKSKLLTQK